MLSSKYTKGNVHIFKPLRALWINFQICIYKYIPSNILKSIEFVGLKFFIRLSLCIGILIFN